MKISPEQEADIRLNTSQFKIYAERLLDLGTRPDTLITLISFLAYEKGLTLDKKGFIDTK